MDFQQNNRCNRCTRGVHLFSVENVYVRKIGKIQEFLRFLHGDIIRVVKKPAQIENPKTHALTHAHFLEKPAEITRNFLARDTRGPAHF